MDELIKRLRRAANVCEEWPADVNPPLSAWSALMTEAADALESDEEEPADLDYWVGDKDESDG